MAKKKQKKQIEEIEQVNIEKSPYSNLLKKKSIKELIAPSGIDASNLDYLKIISSTTKPISKDEMKSLIIC